MARTKKAQVENTTAQAAAVGNASKAATLCAALKTFCNSLAELAKQAGRTDFTLNQLLRESYNLQEQELDTFEGWKAKGASVRKVQHAYLFLGRTGRERKRLYILPRSLQIFTRASTFRKR